METGRSEFGLPQGAEELVAVADIMAQAFAMSPSDSVTWVEKVGSANLRVLRQQGTVVATSNFVVTVWWGLDVLLAWLAPRDNRVIEFQRFLITLLTFVSFLLATVVFRVGFGHNLGIVITVVIAGCLIYRLLDAVAGTEQPTGWA